MVPKTIAIIPDGNRTWARQAGQPAMFGHAQAVANFPKLAEFAFGAGVENIAIWLASELNLQKRSEEEVASIFVLLKQELTRVISEAETQNTRVHICGEWQKYRKDDELVKLIAEAEAKTAHHTKNLTILFGYSGVTDILHATKTLQNSGEEVTDETFAKHLLSAHIPEVDLVIRTKGKEPHWSDALLAWQTRNAELYFTDKLWPEFTPLDLQTAFDDYAKRERKLGA
jgi:undecaprenyl diphosphate synthase